MQQSRQRLNQTVFWLPLPLLLLALTMFAAAIDAVAMVAAAACGHLSLISPWDPAAIPFSADDEHAVGTSRRNGSRVLRRTERQTLPNGSIASRPEYCLLEVACSPFTGMPRIMW